MTMTIAANMKAQFGINFMTIGVGTSRESEFSVKVDELFLKSLDQTDWNWEDKLVMYYYSPRKS